MSTVFERVWEKALTMISKKGSEMASVFQPRSNDVFVCTPGKCGTTWMQQIMHQLRSGGDMNFAFIDEVIPWLDIAYDMGLDMTVEQTQAPRCFKTHLHYDKCPKGAKYIVIYREPCSTMYSLYRFMEGFYVPPGEMTFDDVVEGMKLYPFYFDHLLSWWPQRNEPNVLILFYEDMLQDLETSVRQVAQFVEINDEEKILSAVQMSKFDFMKENQDKFATHLAYSRHQALGNTEINMGQRVNILSGTKGLQAMSPKSKQTLQKLWNEKIKKEFGFENYDELKIEFKKEQMK